MTSHELRVLLPSRRDSSPECAGWVNPAGPPLQLMIMWSSRRTPKFAVDAVGRSLDTFPSRAQHGSCRPRHQIGHSCTSRPEPWQVSCGGAAGPRYSRSVSADAIDKRRGRRLCRILAAVSRRLRREAAACAASQDSRRRLAPGRLADSQGAGACREKPSGPGAPVCRIRIMSPIIQRTYGRGHTPWRIGRGASTNSYRR